MHAADDTLSKSPGGSPSAVLLFCLEFVAGGILVLSLSVAAVVLFRPFYYIQIDLLQLEDISGLSYDEIKQSYDDTLDYCCGLREDYRAGNLSFTKDAAAHFADVRGLFSVDFLLLALSAACICVLLLLRRHRRYIPLRPLGFGATFWCGCALLGSELLLGAAFAVNFTAAFAMFHRIFFPGKDNWIFDPEADPIINLLPEAFFRNCAIAIAGLTAIMSAVFIVRGICYHKDNAVRETRR